MYFSESRLYDKKVIKILLQFLWLVFIFFTLRFAIYLHLIFLQESIG